MRVRRRRHRGMEAAERGAPAHPRTARRSPRDRRADQVRPRRRRVVAVATTRRGRPPRRNVPRRCADRAVQRVTGAGTTDAARRTRRSWCATHRRPRPIAIARACGSTGCSRRRAAAPSSPARSPAGRCASSSTSPCGRAASEVRVRAIQTHGASVAVARARQPGRAEPRRRRPRPDRPRRRARRRRAVAADRSRFDASLHVLASLDHDVSRRGAYLAYIGSGELPVQLRVLGQRGHRAGRRRARPAAPATPRCRCCPATGSCCASPAASETVGGGEVLDVAPVLPASKAQPRPQRRAGDRRAWRGGDRRVGGAHRRTPITDGRPLGRRPDAAREAARPAARATPNPSAGCGSRRTRRAGAGRDREPRRRPDRGRAGATGGGTATLWPTTRRRRAASGRRVPQRTGGSHARGAARARPARQRCSSATASSSTATRSMWPHVAPPSCWPNTRMGSRSRSCARRSARPASSRCPWPTSSTPAGSPAAEATSASPGPASRPRNPSVPSHPVGGRRHTPTGGSSVAR